LLTGYQYRKKYRFIQPIYHMTLEPKFKNGDLVQGYYTFIEEYYWYTGEDKPHYHIGVVIDCEYDDYFFDQYLYTVLCLDQVKRMFVESEMVKYV